MRSAFLQQVGRNPKPILVFLGSVRQVKEQQAPSHFIDHRPHITMVSVASLLNPLPTSVKKDKGSAPAELQTGTSLSVPSATPGLTGNTMSKSAAIFIKGRAKGAINYMPYETQDEELAAEHRKFQMEPIGRIGDYPRHIPYSSDKKSFQKRTGRDALEGDNHV